MLIDSTMLSYYEIIYTPLFDTVQLHAVENLNTLLGHMHRKINTASLLQKISKSTHAKTISKKLLLFNIFSRKRHTTNENHVKVFNEYLCESIKYASIPLNGVEASRLPIIVYECGEFLKKNSRLETIGTFKL